MRICRGLWARGEPSAGLPRYYSHSLSRRCLDQAVDPEDESLPGDCGEGQSGEERAEPAAAGETVQCDSARCRSGHHDEEEMLADHINAVVGDEEERRDQGPGGEQDNCLPR